MAGQQRPRRYQKFPERLSFFYFLFISLKISFHSLSIPCIFLLKLKFEQLKECDVAHLVRILDAKIPDLSVRTLTGMRASTAEPVTEDFLSYGDACIVLAQVRSRALKGSISPADLKETLLGKAVVRYTTLTEMPVRISAKETVQLLCDIWCAQVPEVPGSEPSASSSSAPEMPGSERLASFSSIPEAPGSEREYSGKIDIDEL